MRGFAVGHVPAVSARRTSLRGPTDRSADCAGSTSALHSGHGIWRDSQEWEARLSDRSQALQQQYDSAADRHDAGALRGAADERDKLAQEYDELPRVLDDVAAERDLMALQRDLIASERDRVTRAKTQDEDPGWPDPTRRWPHPNSFRHSHINTDRTVKITYTIKRDVTVRCHRAAGHGFAQDQVAIGFGGWSGFSPDADRGGTVGRRPRYADAGRGCRVRSRLMPAGLVRLQPSQESARP